MMIEKDEKIKVFQGSSHEMLNQVHKETETGLCLHVTAVETKTKAKCLNGEHKQGRHRVGKVKINTA